jgi:hypothetical protein
VHGGVFSSSSSSLPSKSPCLTFDVVHKAAAKFYVELKVAQDLARLELSEKKGSPAKHIVRLHNAVDLSSVASKKNPHGFKLVMEEKREFEFALDSSAQLNEWFTLVDGFVRLLACGGCQLAEIHLLFVLSFSNPSGKEAWAATTFSHARRRSRPCRPRCRN